MHFSSPSLLVFFQNAAFTNTTNGNQVSVRDTFEFEMVWETSITAKVPQTAAQGTGKGPPWTTGRSETCNLNQTPEKTTCEMPRVLDILGNPLMQRAARVCEWAMVVCVIVRT